MNRAIIVAGLLCLSPLPALAQSLPQGDYRDRPYDDRDGRRGDLRHGFGEGQNRDRRRMDADDGPGGGASFHMKVGGAQVDVECGPRETVKDCVEAATALLDKARSLPAANGASAAPGGAQTKQ